MSKDAKNSPCFGRVLRLRRCAAAGALMLGTALFIAVPMGEGADARAEAHEPLVSASSFRVMCTSDWGHVAYLEMYAACRAYVSAVADILLAGQSVGNARACLDQEVTKGQATEAVVAWMRAHPKSQDLTAVEMAALALAQKYPCS